jgi:hypothetical protein
VLEGGWRGSRCLGGFEGGRERGGPGESQEEGTVSSARGPGGGGGREVFSTYDIEGNPGVDSDSGVFDYRVKRDANHSEPIVGTDQVVVPEMDVKITARVFEVRFKFEGLIPAEGGQWSLVNPGPTNKKKRYRREGTGKEKAAEKKSLLPHPSLRSNRAILVGDSQQLPATVRLQTFLLAVLLDTQARMVGSQREAAFKKATGLKIWVWAYRGLREFSITLVLSRRWGMKEAVKIQ